LGGLPNHAQYIEKALASFSAQETDFAVEVLIGDDLSTDGTQDLVRSFASSENCYVKPIYNDRNLGPYRNLKNLLSLARGKFVAYCEGDDYWTDPLKLQKQIDFLNANQDVVLTYGSVNSHLMKEKPCLDYSYLGGANIDHDVESLKRAPAINSPTALFRNVLPTLPQEFICAGTGDRFIWSLLGHYGRGVFLQGILPTIYRQHPNGIHSSLSLGGKLILDIKTHYSLFHYYKRISNSTLELFFSEACRLLISDVLKLSDEKSISHLLHLPQHMHEISDDDFALDTRPLENLITNYSR